MKNKLIIPTLIALGFTSCTLSNVNHSFTNVEESHLVSFDSDGGSFIKTQKIEEGSTAKKPKNPVKSGYAFCGWYLDKERKEEFNFDTKILSDTVVYAKWDENYYNFTFESEKRSCMINSKFHVIDKVTKGETYVRYTVTAADGYILPEKPVIPEGITYKRQDNLRVANLTIVEMNHDYKVKIDGTAADKITLTLDPGANCTIDGKTQKTEIEFTPGVIERVYYIKPNDGYNVPTLEQLNIQYDGDFKDYDYDDVNGTLTIHKLYSNFSVAPELSRYVKFTCYATYGDFEIQSSSKKDSYSQFNGKLSTNDVDESGKLIIFYKIPSHIGYDLKRDQVLVSVNGTDFSDFEFGYAPDKNNYLITIANALNYETIFINIQTRHSHENRWVTFSEKDCPDLANWAVKVNGEFNSIIPAPYDKQQDFYVNITIEMNSASFYRMKTQNIKFVSDDKDIPFILADHDTKGEYASFFVNLKGIDSFNIDLGHDVAEPRKLDELTFDQIKDIAYRFDNPDDYFDIGDLKNVKLFENGKEQSFYHRVRIIGFNHDEIDEGASTHKAKITFEFADLLSKESDDEFGVHWGDDEQIFPTLYKFKEYENDKVDNFLKGEFADKMIPEDMKRAAHPAIKGVFKNNGKEAYDIRREFFILSNKEISGKDLSGTHDDCSMYEYYDLNNTDKARIKKRAHGSNYNGYYLRTSRTGAMDGIYAEHGELGWVSGSTGKIENISANAYGNNEKYTFAPAFCI